MAGTSVPRRVLLAGGGTAGHTSPLLATADALRRRIFQLRANVSAYDAAYVVLAEALDCPLLTRDLRLARSSGHLVRIEVR